MSQANKVALVSGGTGQDGSYLIRFLLSKGYEVWATSRDAQGATYSNWRRLGLPFDKVKVISLVPEDFRSVYMALRRVRPDEIYHLAGQSSVGLSFEQPAETIESVALGTLNMLEACRLAEHPVKLYHAGSSECFGDTLGKAATELTPLHPSSPYAVAKSTAFWLVDNYRRAYDLYACTGILFNHESPLRPARFVTQKIVSEAKRISQGITDRLTLGRIDISRDWGWAPEYVEAMWLMLQQEYPEDYVIATGHTSTLESFVDEVFSQLGLSWKDHVSVDMSLYRPTDLLVSKADPTKAERQLGWKAKYGVRDIVREMLSAT